MSNSSASKNLAMQMVQGAYNGLKGIGKSIRNVVEKRKTVQKMWEQDQTQGVGNYYESRKDVMKRHNMK